MPHLLQAVETGTIAARMLRRNATGHVAAAFDRSFYVDLAGTLLCFGSASLPMGPINVRLQSSPEHLDIGTQATVNFCASRIWVPPEPVDWTLDTLRDGLSAIDVVARRQVPAEGLSCLVFGQGYPATEGPLHRRAARAIDSMRQWLSADGAENMPIEDGVRGLIGLGPGLTPSGDDLLVGTMVALAETQKYDLLDALSAAVQKNTVKRTSLISAAHLGAAAEGLGAAALHRTIQSIIRAGSGLTENLSDLADIGHSSGWDALAGAVVVLQQLAFLATPGPEQSRKRFPLISSSFGNSTADFRCQK